jgi:O-antigen/teichoic acid export membrane protein
VNRSALVADPVVRHVFGADYLPAVPVVQVFGAYILVHAVNKITADGLDYLGRARSRAVAKGTMAVANFTLNLLLIPLMGVVGAAVATVATYSVYTGVNLYVIHDELALRVAYLARWVAAVCGVSLGMAAAVGAVVPYISGLPTLVGVIGLGVAVWAALAVGSGLLDVRRLASLLA